jgi:RNA polymerase primary sigma factor
MRAIKFETSITSRGENSLHRYLGELDKMELISQQEEIALAKKVKEGDAAALDKLIKANLRFVVSCAKKYQHLGMSLSDLISEGNLGLIKAAKLFDETRGFKFISFAVWWIRQSMMAALGQDVRMIRLPMNIVQASSDIRKVAESLEQQLERVPTEKEITSMLTRETPKIAMGYAFGGKVVSLDNPVREDSPTSLRETTADHAIASPDEQLITESRQIELQRLLSALREHEQLVLRANFGIGVEPRGLEELSIDMGLSKERVRQIRQSALAKIKGLLERKENVVYGKQLVFAEKTVVKSKKRSKGGQA